MFQNFILVCFIAGVAQAGVLPAAQVVEEYDAYPQYNYGYSVQDPITGDFKGQEETRDGSVVRGRYSLMEPDGTFRVVTYMADDSGFHAVVERHGQAVSVAPRPQPVHTVTVQQPRPVHVQVQVPFRPVQQVEVVQEQRPVHVVQEVEQVQVQPAPVEVPHPQPVYPEPQPIPQPQPQPQPHPQPIPQPHPQPIPQPQPQPIPQPQPQPIPQPPQQQPQPIPQPQPQPIARPPRPQPPQPEESFDDAEVIEARRADSGIGQGSLSSYRSSRNGQHDFNFSF